MKKYQDKTLSVEERAEDIVSRMTLEEKASQLRYDAPAIERLGIPAYNWWNETLHGIARAGTATVFPQAIALAAIFDDEYLGEIANVFATEARAKYNAQVKFGDRDIYKGLTFWTPNINIFRDPRWGRGHETYGEDPYLTARLGVGFIKGLQGDGKVIKAAACAKHYAVHSGPESQRHEFDATATDKDLWETYLHAFEAAVTEGGVESVMGAYNRTNGEPCCGSKTLLSDILREKWGFKGHVVSDCWAIRDFHTTHKITKNVRESIAMALKNGCDLNCGNSYIHMMKAYEEGLVTEEEITTSAKRLFATRIRLGMFDDDCEFDSISYEANDCEEHSIKSLEAARKSMVLLKNDGVLPIDKSKLKAIGVIGPNADSRVMLEGNYSGTSSEYVTILNGVREAIGSGTRLYYSEGCHLYKDRVETLALEDDRLSEVQAICELSDVVVLCLGMDSTIEGEQGDTGNSDASGDKLNLDLPGRQQKLLETVVSMGKPVILILGVGSALAINYAQEHCAAILNVWYPGGQGGRATADILFGKYSPGGKLPVTFYKSTDDLPEFTDYSMKNRTYRYFTGEALYPFGYGLTYSTVELSDLKADNSGSVGKELTIAITLKNTGTYDVEEVVQCYIKNIDSDLAPANHSLCAFKRIALKSGESKTVELSISPASFEVVNDKGERVIDGKKFLIYAGVSQPDSRSIELKGLKPLSFEHELE